MNTDLPKALFLYALNYNLSSQDDEFWGSELAEDIGNKAYDLSCGLIGTTDLNFHEDFDFGRSTDLEIYKGSIKGLIKNLKQQLPDGNSLFVVMRSGSEFTQNSKARDVFSSLFLTEVITDQELAGSGKPSESQLEKLRSLKPMEGIFLNGEGMGTFFRLPV